MAPAQAQQLCTAKPSHIRLPSLRCTLCLSDDDKHHHIFRLIVIESSRVDRQQDPHLAVNHKVLRHAWVMASSLEAVQRVLRSGTAGYATAAAAALAAKWVHGAWNSEPATPRYCRPAAHGHSAVVFDPTSAPQASCGSQAVRWLLVALVAGKARGWRRWSVAQRVAFVLMAITAIRNVFSLLPLRVWLGGRGARISGLAWAVRSGARRGSREEADAITAARKLVVANSVAVSRSVLDWMGLSNQAAFARVAASRITVRRPDGSDMTVFTFTPSCSPESLLPTSCLVYYHGGGYVLPHVHGGMSPHANR